MTGIITNPPPNSPINKLPSQVDIIISRLEGEHFRKYIFLGVLINGIAPFAPKDA